MVETEVRDLDLRELPSNIEYYCIGTDGTLSVSSRLKADVYIDEFQMQRLFDKSLMLHIRQTYGPYIGVMREKVFPVQPQKKRTAKMLLGVIKKSKT